MNINKYTEKAREAVASALDLAQRVMASIQEHGERVQLLAFAAAQKIDE